jgi:RND superfamily putative drug exporter
MPNSHSISRPDGALAHVVRRLSGAAARRSRLTIALWLLLVVACVAAGATVGTKSLTDAQSGVGESGRAEAIISAAHLKRPAQESILVSSPTATTTKATAQALESKLRAFPRAGAVDGPDNRPALARADGRGVLVQVTLRGDPDKAGDRVGGVQRVVTAVAGSHPEATLREAGDGTFEKAF